MKKSYLFGSLVVVVLVAAVLFANAETMLGKFAKWGNELTVIVHPETTSAPKYAVAGNKVYLGTFKFTAVGAEFTVQELYFMNNQKMNNPAIDSLELAVAYGSGTMAEEVVIGKATMMQSTKTPSTAKFTFGVEQFEVPKDSSVNLRVYGMMSNSANVKVSGLMPQISLVRVTGMNNETGEKGGKSFTNLKGQPVIAVNNKIIVTTGADSPSGYQAPGKNIKIAEFALMTDDNSTDPKGNDVMLDLMNIGLAGQNIAVENVYLWPKEKKGLFGVGGLGNGNADNNGFLNTKIHFKIGEIFGDGEKIGYKTISETSKKLFVVTADVKKINPAQPATLTTFMKNEDGIFSVAKSGKDYSTDIKWSDSMNSFYGANENQLNFGTLQF